MTRRQLKSAPKKSFVPPAQKFKSSALFAQLAMRTKKGAPSVLNDAPYLHPATCTCFLVTPIHHQPFLKNSLASVKVSPIGNGCPATADSLFQNERNQPADCRPFHFGESAGRFLRIHFRRIKDLGGINIADTCKHLLVERKKVLIDIFRLLAAAARISASGSKRASREANGYGSPRLKTIVPKRRGSIRKIHPLSILMQKRACRGNSSVSDQNSLPVMRR